MRRILNRSFAILGTNTRINACTRKTGSYGHGFLHSSLLLSFSLVLYIHTIDLFHPRIFMFDVRHWIASVALNGSLPMPLVTTSSKLGRKGTSTEREICPKQENAFKEEAIVNSLLLPYALLLVSTYGVASSTFLLRHHFMSLIPHLSFSLSFFLFRIILQGYFSGWQSHWQPIFRHSFISLHSLTPQFDDQEPNTSGRSRFVRQR